MKKRIRQDVFDGFSQEVKDVIANKDSKNQPEKDIDLENVAITKTEQEQNASVQREEKENTQENKVDGNEEK